MKWSCFREREAGSDAATVTTGWAVPVIRVFIVARIRLYREGLAAMLPRRDDIAVVGTAESWEAGADDVRRLRPDIVLLDMAVADGSNAIREIVAGTDGVKVVALAVPESEREVIAYAEAGVSGYVTREQSLADLVAAVESAARGQVACSPRVAAALLQRVTALSNPSPAGDSRLTRRESEIATLLDEGLSNKEIAQRLCIERATVKNHVHNILEKLEVRSRFEVAHRVGARSDTRSSPV
jgi:two-component system nitrate/nitrite response regulator NarL